MFMRSTNTIGFIKKELGKKYSKQWESCLITVGLDAFLVCAQNKHNKVFGDISVNASRKKK